MRIDKFLTIAGLIRSRTYSKKACDKGYILINGKLAKPSQHVNEGDIVELDLPAGYMKIKVLKIPKTKNVRKEERKELYELMEKRRFKL